MRSTPLARVRCGHDDPVILRLLPALLSALLLAACTTPAPVPPDQDDPAFEVTLDRAWTLVPNDLTPGHATLGWTVAPPEGVEAATVWLDGEQLDGPALSGSIDLSGLAPATHELLFAEQGAEVGFATRSFVHTHPLYVLISVDWDRADTEDHELDWQDQLHVDHPALRLTHFVGPWTFTEPEMTAARMELLTDWLLANEADHDDEIGLHIHPYCSFVETTSVPCRHQPSFAYAEGDPTGYTVVSAAYTEAEYTELALAADAIFADHGLPKPTSYRAGGWTADEGTLRALAAAGHVADTSAVHWRLLEEWEDEWDNLLWDWTRTHWEGIDERSQPYYPSEDAADAPGSPSIPILEVPDNAALADYAEADEVIEVLEANWDGGVLEAPKVLSYGYHNSTAGPMWSYRDRVEGVLEHVDQSLAEDDAGPLIYATLSEMPSVWPR
jgi:hypothetical protein